MKVLVVGGGGREHALAWKIAASPRAERVWCAPGNGGTQSLAENVPIAADDVEALYRFAKQNGADLTVVGPEAPLAAGIVDRFEGGGLRIFGPSQRAARLESSKLFAKGVMRKHTIPTGEHRAFSRAADVRRHLEVTDLPVVIKADGLAAGKGVYICATEEEAERAVKALLEDRVHGAAADRVLVEEFLVGDEVSVHALTDGNAIAVLEDARDYKRLKNGGEGPNTGGMGAVSPGGRLDARGFMAVEEQVLVPTVHGMNREECPYRGALYAGLMLTPAGPKVLEFNVRFGDPETQALMMRLQSDLVELMLAVAEGRLAEQELAWDPRTAVTVVMASAGYPGKAITGLEVTGIDGAESLGDVRVFQAGTARARNGALVTSGGRVLSVTALGDTREAARARAYEAVHRIHFDGAVYRTDIAAEA
jgi:phosphoribosylamine--glycine ligase